MICPRCGWVMRLLNVRKHVKYCDELYQCKCGTTHLHIVPKHYSFSSDSHVKINQSTQPSENK